MRTFCSPTDQVYLLHFDRPYFHAQHYLGLSKNTPQRYKQHLALQGVGLTRAVIEAGIGITLARVWPRGGWQLEQRLRARKNSKHLCPICNPTAGRYPVNPRRSVRRNKYDPF